MANPFLNPAKYALDIYKRNQMGPPTQAQNTPRQQGPWGSMGAIGNILGIRQNVSTGQGLRDPAEFNPYSNLLSGDDIADINDISARTRLALAEYEVNRQANEREADYERAQLQRDRQIREMAAQLGIQGSNDQFNQLLPQLQQQGAQTAAQYATGAQGVLDAYQGSARDLPTGEVAQTLEQQLAAITGGQTDNFAQQVNSPVEEMLRTLTSSGVAGQQNLQARGQGEQAAYQEAIPGFERVRDTAASDIRLEADAEIQNILNQIQSIQPEFIPFNYGELLLNEQGNIRDVIRRAMLTRQDEIKQNEQEERDRTRYTGLEGVEQYAASIGRPELAQWFSQRLQEAQSQGLPPESIAQAISIASNPNDPSYGLGLEGLGDAITRLQERNRGLANPSVWSQLWSGITGNNAASDLRDQFSLDELSDPNFPGWVYGRDVEYTRNASVLDTLEDLRRRLQPVSSQLRQQASTKYPQDELQRMLQIFLGNYASYA